MSKCVSHKSKKETNVRCPHNAIAGMFCGKHKNCQQTSEKLHIKIPIEVDVETDDLNVEWYLPEDPVFHTISPNVVLIPIKGKILINLPYCGEKYVTVPFMGPVTLGKFIDTVNEFYRHHIAALNKFSKKRNNIKDLLGDHIFPESLDKNPDGSYKLFLGS